MPRAACGLIADDLTGALDAGAPFLRAGLRAALPFSGDPAAVPLAGVVLLNTETRESDPQRAADLTREAAQRLRAWGVQRVYKKIDSVLRGHPGPELAAVLDVFGGRALVAPAFPAQGRTTLDGVQHVHGRAVQRFGGRLDLALQEAGGRIDVQDALTDADLARVARQGAGDPQVRVWCGSAGLAAYAAAAWGLAPGAPAGTGGAEGAGPFTEAEPRRAAPARVCVVAGSGHEATARQLDALLAAGWPSRRLAPFPGGADPEEVARWVGSSTAPGGVVVSFGAGLDGAQRAALLAVPPATPRQLLDLLRRFGRALSPATRAPGLGLILTGGETALTVCRAMGGTSIEVLGEALPGAPLGVLRGPGWEVPLATKSGGFGAPDALLRTAEALLGSLG